MEVTPRPLTLRGGVPAIGGPSWRVAPSSRPEGRPGAWARPPSGPPRFAPTSMGEARQRAGRGGPSPRLARARFVTGTMPTKVAAKVA